MLTCNEILACVIFIKRKSQSRELLSESITIGLQLNISTRLLYNSIGQQSDETQ